jgi:hypothetical protein
MYNRRCFWRFPLDQAAVTGGVWGLRFGLTGITVTVYSTSHGSCAGRAVSGSTCGFGPGLRGAKGRPSRRSSIAIHSGLPSGRPMAATRSIRVVAAASAGIARRAAKSEISARNGATVVNSSSSPASCARVLDRGQRGTAHQATIGLSAMYDAAANRRGLSITAPKRPWDRWPVHRNRC